MEASLDTFAPADTSLLHRLPVADAVQIAGMIELYAEEARHEADSAMQNVLPAMVGTPDPAWREAAASVHDDAQRRFNQRVAELFATAGL